MPAHPVFHTFHTYRFSPYQHSNSSIPVPYTTNNAYIFNATLHVNRDHQQYREQNKTSTAEGSAVSTTTNTITPWRPSTRLRKLQKLFTNTILYQHPCIPCVYCGKLMYPTKTQWKQYDENTIYPIEEHYSDVEIILRKTDSRILIPVCTKCKSNKQTIPCPHLHPVPQQIQSVPMMQRRFLSPIFLHCSLGRNTGDNPFSEYRILTGDMKFSKNMRALKLYSGTMGAFLPAEIQNNNYAW